MRFFGFWTMFVALVISFVAAYYSIVGLVAIFAASAIPVIIMGSALEVGKITSAVWLHLNWHKPGFLIKTYLTVATLLLMFITSMGIFGFLSKAHIEQTAVATEGQAQLVRIEKEIERAETIIARAEGKIVKLETADTTADDEVQRKIQAEIARIDATSARIERTVTDLQISLDASIAPWQTEFDTAVAQLAKLDELSAINTRDRDAVRTLQTFVKARPDGAWGTKTAERVEDFKQELEDKKLTSLARIQSLRDDTAQEVQRVRGLGEQEIAQSNTVIARLQDQLGTTRNTDADAQIQEQLEIVATANTEIDELIERKYDIEAESRMLEAEVGPVKYIAELVYGNDAGKDALETAVRWVILILVAVFDPLAVVLVIAGLTILEREHAKRKKSEPQPAPAPVVEEPVLEDFTEEAVEETLESLPEFDISEVEPQETLAQPEEPVYIKQKEVEYHTDSTGTYTIDEETGQRNYIRNADQIRLNQASRDKQRAQTANKIIEQMKEEGNWPNLEQASVTLDDIISSDEEVAKLIAQADETTLKEVLKEINKGTDKG